MNKKKKLASRLQAMVEQFKRGKGHLPPDPEQSNHMRAALANVAIAAFLEASSGDISEIRKTSSRVRRGLHHRFHITGTRHPPRPSLHTARDRRAHLQSPESSQ